LVTQSPSITTATNLAGGGQGQIPIQSGVGATTFISGGSAGQYLKKTSTGAVWATISTGTTVEGNPSGSVTESDLLSKIKINNKVYGVSAVKANETVPSGAANLTSIKIGGTVYAVPSCNVPSASGQNGKVLSASGNTPVWTSQDDLNVGKAQKAFGLSAFSMSYSGGVLTITYAEESNGN
jgi:DNA/RNA endonuclease YhcR with UshA esterase domain